MEINKEKPWFNFKNLESGKVVLEIFGVIGWDVWLQSFSSQLKNLSEDVTEIEVLIASEGGYITDGIAIYNMLKMHPAKIITNIISHAWSIASIISLAGDVRRMASNATIVIHNPWGGGSGEAKDFRKSADVLDMQKENLINTYKEVLNLSREEISDMMDAETWLLAEEAKELGFITEITGVSEQAAAYVSGDENSLIKNSKAKFKALSKPKTEGTQNMDTENNNSSADPQNSEATPATAQPISNELANEAAELVNVTTEPAVNLADERARASKITQICNQAGAPEKAIDFITQGHSVDKAKAELFDSLSNSSLSTSINDSTDAAGPGESANPLLDNMEARYPKK